MKISQIAIASVLLCLTGSTLDAAAQQLQFQAMPTASQQKPAAGEAPKLEHFDIHNIDTSLDACQDFYKYSCSKWTAANPIPGDQVAWGTASGLDYWNEDIKKRRREP